MRRFVASREMREDGLFQPPDEVLTRRDGADVALDSQEQLGGWIRRLSRSTFGKFGYVSLALGSAARSAAPLDSASRERVSAVWEQRDRYLGVTVPPEPKRREVE